MHFPVFSIITAAVLGLIFGSFTSMASHRLPRGESLIKGRSHCPKCNHVLGVKDLVPILSWLWTWGKCRYCNAHIPFSYMLHELILGILFALIFIVYSYSPFTPILWGVSVCLVILIAVDLEHYYLPDTVQIPLFILGISYGFFAYPTLLESLFGSLVFAILGLGLRLLGYIFKKGEALGWGDVKFFGVAGLFLGLDLTKATLFFLCSGIIGIITSVIWNHANKGRFFPFGPALAIALLIILLIPDIQQIIPSISRHLINLIYTST